jgi:energy-converting hydrogenase Eha subunit G
MFNSNSKKDWFGAAITAGLGAGIVTSLAVSHGQNPLIAMAITLSSIVAALLLDYLLTAFPKL